MRSIWKGYIRCSLFTIPVKVFNAVETGDAVHFNQLHAGCGGRVGYLKQCKACGECLSESAIVKGYEHAPDEYAIVTRDDLAGIRLQSTRCIDLEAFVDAAEVPAALLEAPYYAGPDGAVGAKGYALLATALRASGKVGIGKVVLRDREDPVMVAPIEDGLAVYRLRFPGEVRAVAAVPGVDVAGKVTLAPAEVELARELIGSMVRPFADVAAGLEDGYASALRAVIEAKIAGEEITSAPTTEPEVVDIMTALRRSMEKAARVKAKPAPRRRKQASGTQMEREHPAYTFEEA